MRLRVVVVLSFWSIFLFCSSGVCEEERKVYAVVVPEAAESPGNWETVSYKEKSAVDAYQASMATPFKGESKWMRLPDLMKKKGAEASRQVIEMSEKAFKQSVSSTLKLIDETVAEFEGQSKNYEIDEVEIGITITAGGNVAVASGSAESSLKFTLKKKGKK